MDYKSKEWSIACADAKAVDTPRQRRKHASGYGKVAMSDGTSVRRGPPGPPSRGRPVDAVLLVENREGRSRFTDQSDFPPRECDAHVQKTHRRERD